ncbi:tyrosine-type recombinase/integrase [Bdellovibrio sp.]|uniref:tyrosine-type recombinase/integrase n=1 Tax=Bdellovibrio sp. TaxID=28201 RepID=UPI0039E71B95
MGVRYFSEGPKQGYLVTCVGKSSVRLGLTIRKQKYLGLVDEKDAKKAYRQLQLDVASELRERECGEIQWGHLLDLWYREVVLRDVSDTITNKATHDALKIHIKSWFQIGVDKITPLSFQIIVSEMESNRLKRGRIRSVKSAINKIFEWGILKRFIPPTLVCPTRGVRLPMSIKKDRPVLDMTEVRYLLQSAYESNHEYFPVWTVAFETGCRSGELWALKWSDIDFHRKEITVDKSFSFVLNKTKSTKSGKNRILPVSPKFELFLRDLQKQTLKSGYVLPRISSWKNRKGALILRKFCRDIGVVEIPFHGTRACFAMMCLQSGESIPRIMCAGGWSRLSSFQYYVRTAGLNTIGLTDSFDLNVLR